MKRISGLIPYARHTDNRHNGLIMIKSPNSLTFDAMKEMITKMGRLKIQNTFCCYKIIVNYLV